MGKMSAGVMALLVAAASAAWAGEAPRESASVRLPEIEVKARNGAFDHVFPQRVRIRNATGIDLDSAVICLGLLPCIRLGKFKRGQVTGYNIARGAFESDGLILWKRGQRWERGAPLDRVGDQRLPSGHYTYVIYLRPGGLVATRMRRD